MNARHDACTALTDIGQSGYPQEHMPLPDLEKQSPAVSNRDLTGQPGGPSRVGIWQVFDHTTFGVATLYRADKP